MKKQQVPSGRCDPQAQTRTRTNTLHAPLDRSVNCLPHGVFETGPDDRVTEWSIIFPRCFLSAFMIPLPNPKKLPNILFHRWPGLYLALPGSPAFILVAEVRYAVGIQTGHLNGFGQLYVRRNWPCILAIAESGQLWMHLTSPLITIDRQSGDSISSLHANLLFRPIRRVES